MKLLHKIWSSSPYDSEWSLGCWMDSRNSSRCSSPPVQLVELTQQEAERQKEVNTKSEEEEKEGAGPNKLVGLRKDPLYLFFMTLFCVLSV